MTALLLFVAVHGGWPTPAAPPPAEQFFRADHGSAPTGSALPENLDQSVWQVAMDPGHSTPVVHGSKLFLTTYQAKSRELAVVGVDAASGKILWRRAVTVEKVEETHTLGSPATATPACDGQRVFVFFGSYGLICLDLDGKQLWEQRLGPFQDEYGAGSSPILVEGKVILQQDHDVDSFLAAYDCATGRQIWRTARPDAVRSYSTPSIRLHGGKTEILAAGALELAAYSSANGEKLWWINGLARIVIPGPLPAGEMIYMASWAPGGDSGRRLALDPWPTALTRWDKNRDGRLAKAEIDDREVLDRFFRMDLDQSGELDQSEWDRHARVFQQAQNALLAIKPSFARGELRAEDVVWKHQRGVPYVATPVLENGIVWMVKDGGIVTKLDAATGKVLQEERVPGLGNYFASPVAGDGKVYFASEPGVVSVLAAKADWQVLGSRDFHQKIYASPVIAGNRIYIRTEQALHCFEGVKK